MKRIQKYFLMGIIISLSLSGCAGVLEMVVTDTPTPSPTATPAPTATKTPTPTITSTPEPTATATEIPEKYPIDLEKLSTTPESYEYLIAHLDEFVKGPDPLEVGMEEFHKWYSEKLIPALGDWKKRDGNLCYNQLGVGEEMMAVTKCVSDRLFKGQVEFWYFEHNGVVYPVLEIAGIQPDGRIGYSIGVVLVEGFGMQSLGVIKEIKDGQKEFSDIMIRTSDDKEVTVSEDVHRMLEEGFFYESGSGHFLGIGIIHFLDS